MVDAPNPSPDAHAAARACRIARSFACSTPGQCWATNLAHNVLVGSHRIATAIPAWIACGSPACSGVFIRAGPITLPLVWIVIIAFTVVAARAGFAPDTGLAPAYALLLRFTVAWVLISYIATGGAAQVWNLFGLVVSIAAHAGAVLSDAAAAALGGRDTCYPAPTGVGWDGYRSATDALLARLTDILALGSVVGWIALPSLTEFATGLWHMLQLDLDLVYRIIRILFAAVILMISATMTAGFVITLAEAMLVTAVLVAFSPVTAILWIFAPTRGAAVSSFTTAAAAALILAAAGIAVAVSLAIASFAMKAFAAFNINPDAVGAASTLPDGTVVQCPADLPDGMLRDQIQTYLEFVACSSTALPALVYETGGSFELAWVPAMLVFVASLYTISALLRIMVAVCNEITGNQASLGATAATVTSGIQSATGRAGGMLRGGRR